MVKAFQCKIGAETSRPTPGTLQGLLAGRFTPPSPDGEQAAQAEEQQAADGQGSAVGVLREEIERGRAHGRAGEVAQADRRLMDAAVLAFGVTEVHRIKQRRVVDQPDDAAEDDLRQHQHRQVGRHQYGGKGADHYHVGHQQPTETVMPAVPMPQHEECPHAARSTKANNKSRQPWSKAPGASPRRESRR